MDFPDFCKNAIAFSAKGDRTFPSLIYSETLQSYVNFITLIPANQLIGLVVLLGRGRWF